MKYDICSNGGQDPWPCEFPAEKNLDFPVIPDFQGSKKLKKEEEKHGFN